jgi:polysaccharide biosynthesis transport protein
MLDRAVENRMPSSAERRPQSRSAAATPTTPALGHPAIEPEGLTVGVLLAALRRRRWVLVICAALFPLVALVAARQMTPLYTASTKVMYERQDYSDPALRGPTALLQDQTTDAVLASQIEIIRSLSVGRRIVRQFDLTSRPEFAWWLRDAERAETWPFRIRRAAADAIGPWLPALAELVAPAPIARVPPPEQAEISVAESVLDRLIVTVVRSSRVLQVQFTTEDRRLAAAVANLAAELYIADQLEAKFNELRRANDWLDRRVAALRSELQTAENRIIELRERAGLARGNQPGISVEQLGRVNADLIDARNQLASAEARLAAVQRGGGTDLAALGSQSLNAAMTARNEAQRDYERLSATYGQNHPEVRASNARLAATQRAASAEIARVAAALNAEVQAQRARVASLDQSVQQHQERISQTQTAEIQIAALEREAEALRSLLRAVLERSQQTVSATAIEKADARILSPATVPALPSFPKIPTFIAAAAVLGILFGLLVVWFVEQADSTIRSGDEVRSALGLPCFALVPMMKRGILGRHRVEDYVARKPLSPYSESIRTLRAALWLGTDPPKIVVITAARPGEGKTTTAISLARSAAMNGERVLLIDCDIRQPAVGRVFRAEGAPGVTDLLLGQAALEDILRRDHLTSLDYIPAGAAEIHSLGLFMSEAMVHLLERVRREYDLIVLDAPPALAMADARVVARLADATLLCVRWRDTPRSVVRISLGLLEEARARVVGAALTQVDSKSHRRSGYADSEVYHPRYGGYFRE